MTKKAHPRLVSRNEVYRKTAYPGQDDVSNILGVDSLDPSVLAQWFGEYIDPDRTVDPGVDTPEDLADMGLDLFLSDEGEIDVSQELYGALLMAAEAYLDQLKNENESDPSLSDRTEGATYRKGEGEDDVIVSDPSFSGHGKFNNNVDEKVYEWASDGWGEELGDVADFGHYSFLEFTDGITVIDESQGDWTFDVAILEINNNGFVTVAYYDTVSEGEAVWQEIEEEYDKFLTEVEDYDDEY